MMHVDKLKIYFCCAGSHQIRILVIRQLTVAELELLRKT